MGFNSSRLPDSWCSFLTIFNASESTSVYYRVTVTACVISSLLTPIIVTANTLILAAIWKNSSLRTPSYVLLAGLSFTDFFTGLLSLPFFVVNQWADLTGSTEIFCIAALITQIAGYYFSSLTVMVITIMAVERWLHMSRRSLLTVRRVVVLYIVCSFADCVFRLSYVQLVSYKRIFQCIYRRFYVGGSTLFFYNWFLLFQSFPDHTSPSMSSTNKSKRHWHRKIPKVCNHNFVYSCNTFTELRSLRVLPCSS